MTEILSISNLRSYTTNECIFFRGAEPEFCYIVLDGSVQKTKLTATEYFEKFTSTRNINRKIEKYYLESVKVDDKESNIFKMGDIIGKKNLINEKQYFFTCLAREKNTALLLIPKDFFIQKIKEKIVTTDDNLKKVVCRCLQVFIQMGKTVFDRYFNKIIKLFPRYGEFIVNSQQKADSLFIIFQGNFVLNDKNYGDLILLTEGEMFGNESLNDNEKDKKYNYNIISKVSNGVILQFKIENLPDSVLIKMKSHLNDYFKQRKKFINGYINRQNNIRNELSKKYELIKAVKKSKSNHKDIINDKYHYDNKILRINEEVFKKIMENNREIKSKKIKSKRNFNFSTKNININFETINTIDKNKNKFNSPKIKTPFKLFKDNKLTPKNKFSNLFSNKKIHQKVLSWNKLNTENNNIYVTSLETNPTDTISYNNTFANFNRYEKNSEKKKVSFKKKIMSPKVFSKKKRDYFSLKKTGMYEYIKNTIDCFNDGGINYRKNTKLTRPLSSKCFYDTHKYNIPLYVLCDSKEKNQLNIDNLMNFKL